MSRQLVQRIQICSARFRTTGQFDRSPDSVEVQQGFWDWNTIRLRFWQTQTRRVSMFETSAFRTGVTSGRVESA